MGIPEGKWSPGETEVGICLELFFFWFFSGGGQ